MKKIIFTLAVIFAMITVAKADSYLYWMTDLTNLEDNQYSTLDYSYVNIIAKTGTGDDATYQVLNFYADEVGGTAMDKLTKEQVTSAPTYGISGYYADLSNVSDSATFYIELIKDGTPTKSVAISDSISYSDAANAYFAKIDSRGMFIPAAAAWSVSAPEPTSGLLMLLGMAALGLKRRKMTNA